jgi:hypothetical protein
LPPPSDVSRSSPESPSRASLGRRVLAGFLRDWREESFLLILFNFLWVAASLPGWLVLAYGAVGRDLAVVLLGLILLVPWPFFTFALQASAAEVGEGRPVGVSSFFQAGWRSRGAAYAGGGINLLLVLLVASNLRYYGSGASPLGTSLSASLLTSLMLTLAGLWGVCQLFALAALPHLSAARLWPALSASSDLILARPVAAFLVALASAAILLAGVAVPPIGLLFSVSSVAVLSNRFVVEALPDGLRIR